MMGLVFRGCQVTHDCISCCEFLPRIFRGSLRIAISLQDVLTDVASDQGLGAAMVSAAALQVRCSLVLWLLAFVVHAMHSINHSINIALH